MNITTQPDGASQSVGALHRHVTPVKHMTRDWTIEVRLLRARVESCGALEAVCFREVSRPFDVATGDGPVIVKIADDAGNERDAVCATTIS